MKKTSEARLSVAQATTPKGRDGLRMQTRVNWDCFGFALQSSTLTGAAESFMGNHKLFGKPARTSAKIENLDLQTQHHNPEQLKTL